jgi:hypothetical protein
MYAPHQYSIAFVFNVKPQSRHSKTIYSHFPLKRRSNTGVLPVNLVQPRARFVAAAILCPAHNQLAIPRENLSAGKVEIDCQARCQT